MHGYLEHIQQAPVPIVPLAPNPPARGGIAGRCLAFLPVGHDAVKIALHLISYIQPQANYTIASLCGQQACGQPWTLHERCTMYVTRGACAFVCQSNVYVAQPLQHPSRFVFHPNQPLHAGQGYQTLQQDQQMTGVFNMVQPLLLRSPFQQDGGPMFLEARLLGHSRSLGNHSAMLDSFLAQLTAQELKSIKFSFSPTG